MRKTKRFTMDVGGKELELTVLEITVQTVLDFVDDISVDTDMTALLDKVRGALPQFVEGLSSSDLKRMAPSEIEEIWDHWREVNASFFRIASQIGLDQLLATLKMSVTRDCARLLYGLLPSDTEMSGPTDGVRS